MRNLGRSLIRAARLVLAILPGPANLLATFALLAISVGCWWERPSLGLIVPGTIIFVCLIWGRVLRA